MIRSELLCLVFWPRYLYVTGGIIIMVKKLNEQQQQAVDSNSSKILCLAGAGAGKTATMIERISRIVNEGVWPTNILVLTFTNAAGFEMRERYKQKHPNQIIPEFRTFHSFCYSLIVRDKSVRDALGYKSVPTIAEEAEIKKLETQAKMQCNIKLSESKLRGDVRLTESEQYEFELYQKAVKRLIREANIITFDMLCYDVGQLFVDNHPTILKYKDQYKYIFVDEFQDTDMKQIKFLNSFENTNFFFCGDTLQNIYQFRGCTNDTIKLLSKDDSWEQIKLYQNYRSTNQICDFANKMSTYADEVYRIEMNGQRDGDKVKVFGGSCVDWNHPVDEDHIDMLIEEIHQLDSGDAAVLCRTNREVEHVCKVFDSLGIPYATGKRNVDAIHILKSSIDNSYMLDWLATFLNAQKYGEFIRLAAQVENPDIKWFANTYGKQPKINERGKTIVKIRKILKDDTLPIISKCMDILSALGIDDVVLDVVPQDDASIVNHLIEAIEEAQSSELYVGTIHSSKGLEYGTVYVMGVNDKSFPLRGEDMLNLYYVAITRAKNHLVVFRR